MGGIAWLLYVQLLFLRHNRVVIRQTNHWLLWILIKGQCEIITKLFCNIFKLKKHVLLSKSGRRGVKNRDSEEGGTQSILHSSRPSGTLRCSNSKAKQFSVSCTCPEDKQPPFSTPAFFPFLSILFLSFPLCFLFFPFLWFFSSPLLFLPFSFFLLSSPVFYCSLLSFLFLSSPFLSTLSPFLFLSFPSLSSSHLLSVISPFL